MDTTSAWLRIYLEPDDLVEGLKGVDILVDGEMKRSLQWGEGATLEVSPGKLAVQAVVRGVWFIKRRSKVLTVLATEGEQVFVVARYSRFWGKVFLEMGTK